MEFKAIVLPYKNNELEPVMSEKTLDFHFGKHYIAYLNNCNNLKLGTSFENMTLDQVVEKSDGGLYNNAAQVKNHEMFFNTLSPNPVNTISGNFLIAVEKEFGSFDTLKKELEAKSTTFFGSGWTWLVVNLEGNLQIIQGSNAYCPLIVGMKPLMCIDVWEHAYYLDYQNRRADYLSKIWDIFDWSVVQERFDM